jgi:hypothetical protein
MHTTLQRQKAVCLVMKGQLILARRYPSAGRRLKLLIAVHTKAFVGDLVVILCITHGNLLEPWLRGLHHSRVARWRAQGQRFDLFIVASRMPVWILHPPMS